MLWIAGALILGAAIFFVTYTVQVAAESSAAKDRLGLNWDSTEKPFRAPFYLKWTRPLLKGNTLEMAVGFWKPATLEKIQKTLRSAGLHKNVEAAHFVAAKFWLTVIVALFMVIVLLFAEEPPSPTMPIMTILFFFFYPDIHISGMKQNRQTSIRLAMPYVMDLMTLSMEAGMEFQGAITRVAEKSPPGPFIEELNELLKEIQLGKTRADALRKMANAIDIPEITSLVAVLISTDQMGAPVGPVLRAQSDSIRIERLVRAEKLGAQASQKILIPLVFFILPAVFLMIFGPIILQALGVK